MVKYTCTSQLEWVAPLRRGGGAMDISLRDLFMFGMLILALLTYIEKRK